MLRRRCHCVVNKCNQYPDPETGKLEGRLLEAAKWIAHKRAEDKRLLSEAMQDLQSEVLERHEADLVARISELDTKTHPSHNPPANTSPTAQQYRVERDRRHLRVISIVEDNVTAIRKEFERLPALTAEDSVGRFRIRQKALEQFLAKVDPSVTDLQVMQKASSSHSVRAMHRKTKERLDSLVDKIDDALAICRNEVKARIRSADELMASEQGLYMTDHHYSPVLTHVKPLVQLTIFMVIVCSTLLRLSQRGCVWLLSMTAFIIQKAAEHQAFPLPISGYLAELVAEFPRDPTTAKNQFRLDAKYTILATCPNPKCRKTHKPLDESASIPEYRERCDNYIFKTKRGDRTKCRELLVVKKYNVDVSAPIIPYISFDLKDWLAYLLSRPGLELEMDEAWKTMPDPKVGVPEHLVDVFQGSVIREFNGPDGLHFKDGNGEGRYVFSLSVDWFNPLTNKQAGKNLSVGVISLICLNLPIAKRYKPENMFLAGIIPGPREPSLERANHFLTPLVDQLLEFWDPGVYFSRTATHKIGRRVRCAVIALVCDLPAARKISGFAGHRSFHLCSRCKTTNHRPEEEKKPKRKRKRKKKKKKKTEDQDDHIGVDVEPEPKIQPDINNYNMADWEYRTDAECREHSARYREARTAKDAQSMFDQTGKRWSELERLPYFDITRFVVVDCMHNLFLGLLQEHFRHILGFQPTKREQKQAGTTYVPSPVIDIDIAPSVENEYPTKKSDQNDVETLIRWLGQLMSSQLKEDPDFWRDAQKRFSAKNKPALQYIAKGLGLNPSDRLHKKDLAALILKWRAKLPERELTPELDDFDIVRTTGELGEIFTAQEIDEILADIECMVRPSWLTKTSVLRGGKLKADDWRTLCATSLPVSLIRLWSKSQNEQHIRLLDMTMCLVSAVIIASSRTTSAANANQYRVLITRYRELLHKQFPDYKVVPNQHIAFHIGDFLMMYGPAHCWWTFPLERLIGLLQRVPTNYIPGQYEITTAVSFLQSTRLKTIFDRYEFPDILVQCKSMFDRLIAPQLRDTHITDALMYSRSDDDSEDIVMSSWDRAARPLSPGLQSAFTVLAANVSNIQIPKRVRYLTHITVGGTRYAIRSNHDGNSAVLIPTDPRLSHQRSIPARIESILETADGQRFIAVRQHRSVELEDPFRRYPVLQAEIWSPNLHDELTLVHPSMLQEHYASWDVPWVLPGDKELVVTVSVIMSLSRDRVWLTPSPNVGPLD